MPRRVRAYSSGFERNAIRRLLITFGRARLVEPVRLALYVRSAEPRGAGLAALGVGANRGDSARG